MSQVTDQLKKDNPKLYDFLVEVLEQDVQQLMKMPALQKYTSVMVVEIALEFLIEGIMNLEYSQETKKLQCTLSHQSHNFTQQLFAEFGKENVLKTIEKQLFHPQEPVQN